MMPSKYGIRWMPAPETFGKENNRVDAKSQELEKRR
jgi:hypothetical protein